jgi:hypothetical protein
MLLFAFNNQTILAQMNKIEVGVEGGTNYSYIKTKDRDYFWTETPNFGYVFGIKIKYNLNKNFSFSSGLDLDQRGHYRSFRFNVHPYFHGEVKEIANYYFTYLKLPLSFIIGLNYKIFNFHCLIGSYFSYSLAAKIEGTQTREGEAPKYFYGKLNGISNFDNGLLFGTGTTVCIKKNISLTIDSNFELGLAKMTTYDNPPKRNQSFSITAGINYRIVKKKPKTKL